MYSLWITILGMHTWKERKKWKYTFGRGLQYCKSALIICSVIQITYPNFFKRKLFTLQPTSNKNKVTQYMNQPSLTVLLKYNCKVCKEKNINEKAAFRLLRSVICNIYSLGVYFSSFLCLKKKGKKNSGGRRSKENTRLKYWIIVLYTLIL